MYNLFPVLKKTVARRVANPSFAERAALLFRPTAGFPPNPRFNPFEGGLVRPQQAAAGKPVGPPPGPTAETTRRNDGGRPCPRVKLARQKIAQNSQPIPHQ